MLPAIKRALARRSPVLAPPTAHHGAAEVQEAIPDGRLASAEQENSQLKAALRDLETRLDRLGAESNRLILDNVRLREKVGEVLQHHVGTWIASLPGETLGPDDVGAFIAAMDDTFDGHLSSVLNYSRVVSLAHFARSVDRLGLAAQAHVGIVSGTLREWELAFLKPQRVTVLAFDSDPANDLDISWCDRPPQNFSLTICNQVLEHVFNPHVAFRNLVHHTAPGGHLYVTIPTINCIHGEPHFYSSGFHPRFLERLAQESEVELVEVGSWGSYKYMINAVTGYWLSERQLLPGATEGVRFPDLVATDGRIREDRFMTDCWALFRKP